MPAKKPYRKTDRWANEKQLATDIGSGINDVFGRGTLAGLLGAPGDIAGMAENGIRALIGLPQVRPWGGSEHIGQKMQDYGLVSSVRRPKTELLASLISPAQVATASLKAPQYAKTALRLLDNLESAPTMARIGQRGAIDVWHGSPHKFDIFKAMDNIGGGEGAQAYGHGGYHASNKAVADNYAQTLGVSKELSAGQFNPDGTPNRIYQSAFMIDSGVPNDEIIESLVSLGHSQDDARSIVRESQGLFNTLGKSKKNLYRNQLRWPDPAREAADPLSDKHFLDWDKPLSEQPEVAKIIYGDRVDAFGNPMPLSSYDKYTGAMAYEDYSARMGKTALERRDNLLSKYGVDPKAPFPEWKAALGKMSPDDRAEFTAIASEVDRTASHKPASIALNQAGIPGIRYLDGGSRSAGQGSHNYVTFDDALVNILERNGQPVTAPQPGLRKRK